MPLVKEQPGWNLASAVQSVAEVDPAPDLSTRAIEHHVHHHRARLDPRVLAERPVEGRGIGFADHDLVGYPVERLIRSLSWWPRKDN